MPRPLMRNGIAELEQLFSSAKGDIKILQTLEEELKHRNVPRAMALLDKVQRALRAAKPAPRTQATEPAAKPEVKHIASGPAQQGALWGEEPRASKTAVGAKPSQPAEPPSVAAPTEPPVTTAAPAVQSRNLDEALPPMSVDEAYKVLKATSGSSWEAIEETRRRLVQLAHPAKVAGLIHERRAQLESDAKRANAAYSVLIQTRIAGNQG